MEGIKTIVFDLDGTIYQNNSFHPAYIRFLLEGSGREDWADALVAFIDGVYRGEHLVMNACYDLKPIEADRVADYLEALGRLKPADLDFDEAFARRDCIYLGDAWAVVNFIGSTLGLLDGDRGDIVYKKTREQMSADGMRGNMRLRRAIVELGKRYKTVLLTNSYRETAEDFLRQLGFDGVFRQTVYSANKPWELIENLAAQCPEVAREPQSVLSIGDHAFNDLMPMQRLGCKALWINPFRNIHEPAYDLSVSTLDQLACCLEDMCR